MSEPLFRSALAGATAIQSPIKISAIDDRGMIDLRGDIGDRKFAAATKKALGFCLPTTARQSTGARQSTSKAGIAALWLSPDQWLITCPRSDTSRTFENLQNGLANLHSLAVDVSDARSIIRLAGDGAKIVLMKGAPVDLTAPEFDSGYVRRIRFAELAAMVHVVSSEPEMIDLYVFRSHAQYAWDWLCATATDQSGLSIFCRQPVAAV